MHNEYAVIFSFITFQLYICGSHGNLKSFSIVETPDASDNKYATLKFCFRLKKSSAKAFEVLQSVYGVSGLSNITAIIEFRIYEERKQSTSIEGES